MNQLAFARVASNRGGEGEALSRRGHGEWAIVNNPNNFKFKDVVHFKDQILGLCDNGMLVRFVLDAPGSAEVQVIASKPHDVKKPQKLYLMESSENLFVLFRYTPRSSIPGAFLQGILMSEVTESTPLMTTGSTKRTQE